MVADVDVSCEFQSAGVVPVRVGRGDCQPRRNFTRLRGIVRPEIAIAVHGECAGESTQATRGTQMNSFVVRRQSYGVRENLPQRTPGNTEERHRGALQWPL